MSGLLGHSREKIGMKNEKNSKIIAVMVTYNRKKNGLPGD